MEGLPKLRLPPTLNKSRLLALGLLVGVVLLLVAVVIAPVVSLIAGYNETIEDQRFRLQKFQRIAAEKPLLLERLEKLKNASRDDERFISKSTAALASADLQTMIKQAVSEAGGELTSTQVIPERTEEHYTRVAVKVRMNGSTEVLREVLYGFETHKPSLFVENLNIRPIRIPRNPGAKKPQVPDRLSVDFDVVGYMRTE